LLTATQAKDLDKKVFEKFGISTIVLMENAGRRVAQEVLKISRPGKKPVFFCGKGNNGGDGFVAARHLLAHGVRPRVYLAGRIHDVRNEAGSNLDILLRLKQPVIEVSESSLSGIRLPRQGLIIDALLGVGLSGPVRGVYSQIIRRINSSGCSILSVDIPSGLDATTGKIPGACVKADMTVTFVAPKRGMTINEGPRYCGKVIVADIGIPLLNP
jgi:NAD(P)H-hydrate epimerase